MAGRLLVARKIQLAFFPSLAFIFSLFAALGTGNGFPLLHLSSLLAFSLFLPHGEKIQGKLEEKGNISGLSAASTSGYKKK